MLWGFAVSPRKPWVPACEGGTKCVSCVAFRGLARSLFSPSILTIKSTKKFPIDGVNSVCYTGDFVYTNLVSISYWHVKLAGLKFNGAAVKTPYFTPSLILAPALS